MRIFKDVLLILLYLSLLLFSVSTSLLAQTNVTRAIQYRQITNFEENVFINSMKMSSDGSRIVFGTSGPAVKIFTINTDGSGLTEVYDPERNGSGVFTDISADGSKVIWTDGDGEIFIANADGSSRVELATLLPNPNPIFVDIEPYINIPPRITDDGSQVFFIHQDNDPAAAGVWRVNSDNSGLIQLFSFEQFWHEGVGLDSLWLSSFSPGFDISADGSHMIFGTHVLKLEIRDYNNGDAYAFDGEDFYHLGDYRLGDQPLATYIDGDKFMFFRQDNDPGADEVEIGLYSAHLSGTEPIKILGGLSWMAYPRVVQMTDTGDEGIALAGGGSPYDLPISLVNSDGPSHIDLVNIDATTIALGGYRSSYSYLPSINHTGDLFCFVSASAINQIWVAEINSDGIEGDPSISQISFDPPYVLNDGSTTSSFTAHISSQGNDIQAAYFDAFMEGTYRFRALSSDPPWSSLADDGTLGDENSDDGIFTNNSVRIDLQDTPVGLYSIRISATDGQNISAVDAGPFSILEDEPTGVEDYFSGDKVYMLNQNFPNPFNPQTTIVYTLKEQSKIKLRVFDALGKDIAILVDDVMPAGSHSVVFDGMNLPSGVYFYQMLTKDFVDTKKLLLLK